MTPCGKYPVISQLNVVSYKKEKAEQSIVDSAWEVTFLWKQLEIKILFYA